MKKSFTLIELLVVLIIIAILITLAIPQYENLSEKARAGEAINTIGLINTALQLYIMETGLPPPETKDSHYLARLNLPEIPADDATAIASNQFWYYVVGAVSRTGGEALYDIIAYRSSKSNGDTNKYILLRITRNNAGIMQQYWAGTHIGVPTQQ